MTVIFGDETGTTGPPEAHAPTHALPDGSDAVELLLQQILDAGTAAAADVGPASDQVAAGDHTHPLDALSDVSTAGASTGKALVYNGSGWVPTTIAGASTALDDLTDVSTAGALTGYVLTRQSDGSYLFQAQSGGGATTLDALTDVTLTSPASGDQLQYNTSLTQWVNVPGSSGGVTWMVVPALASDTKIFHNAISITAGTNVLTITGASLASGTAEVGKLVYWRTATGTAELAQIKTRTGPTSVTLCNVGDPSSTYSAAATVSNQPGAYGTDDTAALQAAVTSAKALRLPVGLQPATRAMLTNDIDCSNDFGFRLEGLGGGTWVSDNNGVQLGGQILYACKPTAMTVIRCGNNGGSPNNDQAVSAGAHISRVGFSDPSERKVHTAVLTQFQLRNRLEKLHMVNMLEGWRNNSGSKDASWSSIADSTTLACKTHIVFYNAVPITTGAKDPTGAMANEIRNHTYMIGAGETGTDWYGGQYGKIIGGKLDMDGPGCVGHRFRGGVAFASGGSPPWPAGTSPTASKISVFGMVVEATGTLMDNTSVMVDVQGGAGQLSFIGCHIAGAGAANGIGYQIGVNGAGTVQDVTIIGGTTVNRATCLQLGPLSRNTTIIGHGFGGSGKFVRADAASDGTLIIAPRFDIGTDPTTNTARVDVDPAALRFWMRDIRWNGGFSAVPRFAGLPPASWGDIGSGAWNTVTNAKSIRNSTGWVADAGGGGSASTFRVVGMSKSGAMPTSGLPTSGANIADFPEPTLGAISLQELTVIASSPPAGAMKIQLQRSTDQGATWAAVTGFVATFVAGARTASISPGAVVVNDGDLLNFSITSGSSTVTGSANVAVFATGVTP